MEIENCGQFATCGVNGNNVVVSKYNYKCPCLNCMDCKGFQTQCPWKYVLETNPCTDDDMQAIVCQNCIKLTSEHQK